MRAVQDESACRAPFQEDIGANTDQDEITFFRSVVTGYLQRVMRAPSLDETAPPAAQGKAPMGATDDPESLDRT